MYPSVFSVALRAVEEVDSGTVAAQFAALPAASPAPRAEAAPVCCCSATPGLDKAFVQDPTLTNATSYAVFQVRAAARSPFGHTRAREAHAGRAAGVKDLRPLRREPPMEPDQRGLPAARRRGRAPLPAVPLSPGPRPLPPAPPRPQGLPPPPAFWSAAIEAGTSAVVVLGHDERHVNSFFETADPKNARIALPNERTLKCARRAGGCARARMRRRDAPRRRGAAGLLPSLPAPKPARLPLHVLAGACTR
jgi:hypothetical protein